MPIKHLASPHALLASRPHVNFMYSTHGHALTNINVLSKYDGEYYNHNWPCVWNSIQSTNKLEYRIGVGGVHIKER